MTDQKFLLWIYERMASVHGEPLNIDYMGRLASIIEALPDDQATPNTAPDLMHLKESRLSDQSRINQP